MISWEYPPQFSGGLGIHCQQLVQALTKIGVSVDFYLPALSTEKFDIPDGMTLQNVMTHHSSKSNSYHGSAIWDMVKEFKNRLEETFNPEGIAIIHAHDWMGVFAALQLSKKYNIPLVWTVHSTEYDRAAGNPVHPGILAIEQEALMNADHTITVSKRMKQNLVLHYNANPDNITVIYNGINTTSFEVMRDRDYERTDGHILFLGRVTGQKGPEDFLKAARIVLDERQDIRFMIAGDGDLLKRLRRLAKRWKISNRVEFTGGVYGDQMLDCYKNAFLFVLPAVSEPFGITVLEAMASGLPTIITTTTGAGEVVEHVEYVEPGQPHELAKSIIQLLNDPEKRKALGEEGAKEVLQLSWSNIANETKSLYLKLAGS